ncbi:hypothetical protein HAX54_012742 [Datura stramonium]|uniref:Uncharacterized protein n=1 Tax=Datura stramonium TaxID=4076 RepID=A0ABS8TK84_DATST|nr:hypothetical protein [Datura stramonium]
MQALYEMIGRKSFLNPMIDAAIDGDHIISGGSELGSGSGMVRCELAHDPLDFPEISYESLKVSALLPNTVKLSEFIRAIDNLCGFPSLFFHPWRLWHRLA